MAETTTIKLHRTTKAKLDRHRRPKETYDDLLERVLATGARQSLREQLIAGYKATRDRDRAINAEWSAADAPWPE